MYFEVYCIKKPLTVQKSAKRSKNLESQLQAELNSRGFEIVTVSCYGDYQRTVPFVTKRNCLFDIHHSETENEAFFFLVPNNRLFYANDLLLFVSSDVFVDLFEHLFVFCRNSISSDVFEGRIFLSVQNKVS